ARSDEEALDLVTRLRKPVGSTTLADRARLIHSLSPREYDEMVATLEPTGQFDALAPAYAGLVAVLGKSRHQGVKVSELMAWMREQQKQDQFPDVPLAEVMDHLGSILLLNSDLAACKNQLLQQL